MIFPVNAHPLELPSDMAPDYYVCPDCGTEVEVGSAGCPKCLAGQDLDFDGDGIDLDLPEDDLFDYDEFIANEFGGPPRKTKMEWFWWCVAVVLLISFALWAFRCF